MIRKSILLALAAATSLGATMMSSTSADAMVIRGNRGGNIPHVHVYPHFPHHPVIVRWHRPIVYGAPVIGYAAVRPVAAAPGPCTCLTKEYTPEGAVLFKDKCTNEMAMNPPAAQQTGQLEIQPTQPQATR